MKHDFFYSQVVGEKVKSVLVVQSSLRHLDIWMDVSRHIRVWITITATKLDSMFFFVYDCLRRPTVSHLASAD